MSFICVFIKQKTAYEMRISDWSSDVCSSDLRDDRDGDAGDVVGDVVPAEVERGDDGQAEVDPDDPVQDLRAERVLHHQRQQQRSEEHTSELQSLMRNSYAVFCLKKKTSANKHTKKRDEKSNEHYTHEK